MLRTIDRVQNEVLRTRILRVVEAAYPKWTTRAVLFSTLQKSHLDTSLNDLDMNAHYLARKGFFKPRKGRARAKRPFGVSNSLPAALTTSKAASKRSASHPPTS